MSRLVKSNADLLRVLQRANPKLRKAIIKAADAGLIYSLCECAENTIKCRVKLSSPQKAKLSRHKKLLRALTRRGTSWKAKRKTLVQRGGAILPLLLAPLLGNILSGIFNPSWKRGRKWFLSRPKRWHDSATRLWKNQHLINYRIRSIHSTAKWHVYLNWQICRKETSGIYIEKIYNATFISRTLPTAAGKDGRGDYGQGKTHFIYFWNG